MGRETLEVDVLVAGAGPAGLAFAARLRQLCARGGADLSVLVLEKAPQLGQHQLSGAVLDARALLELFPGARAEGFPVQAEVTGDALWILGPRRKLELRGALCPPPLRNEGHWIVSLNEAVRWLAQRAEGLGAQVYAGFGAAELLWEGEDSVAGVRIVDQGRDRAGQPKANFQPGMEVRARLTVLAEGTRGSLTKQLLARAALQQGRNPQLWAVGIKELWEIRQELRGRVIHTAGWPLSGAVYGGGWIYGLPERRVSIGFVMAMDHGDPSFDYHATMQRWKTHPAVAALLEGGQLLRYGAKTLPEGGLFSLPRLCGAGFLIVGDAAGFLNAQRLKGIHLALKSGMVAAEAVHPALQAPGGCLAAERTAPYEAELRRSWLWEELWRTRNFRQAFQRGFLYGLARGGLDALAGGRLPGRLRSVSDHARYRTLDGRPPLAPRAGFDGRLTFDKLTDVYHSGTTHEENQPCHLVVREPDVCASRCTREYGNPCQHFCPAGVYEWRGEQGLRINAANCVHCKTCDIADPYQVIDWMVPEQGGPVYLGM